MNAVIGANPLLCALSGTRSNTPEESREGKGTSSGKKETSDKLQEEKGGGGLAC